MKLYKIAFLFCLALIAENSYALGPLHLDLRGTIGYGKSQVEGEPESPTTMQYGVGTTLGYKFLPFYFGASADYSMVTQLTEPGSFGNRKGKKMNLLSPTIGVRLIKFHLKFDYQILGTYTLDKKTTGGQEVSYEDPKGMRGYIGYRYSPLAEVGVFYETVSYGKEKVGSSETELTNKMKVNQMGLAWLIAI